MAIKVVSVGNTFKPVKARCRTCKSDLEVQEVGDLKKGDFGCPRDPGDVDYEIYVDCPVCGASVILPDQEKLMLQYEIHKKEKKDEK